MQIVARRLPRRWVFSPPIRIYIHVRKEKKKKEKSSYLTALSHPDGLSNSFPFSVQDYDAKTALGVSEPAQREPARG